MKLSVKLILVHFGVIIFYTQIISGPLFAGDLPNAPDLPFPQFPFTEGWSSTGNANNVVLKRANYRDQEIEFLLRDGTKVGGLAFFKPEPAPLLIFSGGFIADRWGFAAAQFIKRIVEKNLVPAHVLVLDHPTSAPFLVNNGYLSIGGYDEAQMILEISQIMNTLGGKVVGPDFPIAPTAWVGKAIPAIKTSHLIGVSMSGMAVIHALIEDKRRGSNLISSGITFSGVSDFAVVPGRALSSYEENGPWGPHVHTPTRWLEKLGFDRVMKHYQEVANDLAGVPVDLNIKALGSFFHSLYSKRLEFLRRTSSDNPQTWNPRFSKASLAGYISSTDAAQIVDQLKTPLIMIHADNDPLVAYEQFHRIQFLGKENPYLLTLGVKYGGHFAFTVAYGDEWVAELIKRALNPSDLAK